MLSPVTTTILSFVVVIVKILILFDVQIVTYISYQISSYYTRKGRGNIFVLINATISFALCFSILAVYVNDIYAYEQGTYLIGRLVYQGDHGIIRHFMSIMLVIYILHTLLIVPALAVFAIVFL